MEIFCSAQHQLGCHWYLRGNSLVHEFRVMSDAELDVNATYCAQNPALKSVNGKSQPVRVTGCK